MIGLVGVIARREVQSSLATPLPWILLGGAQVVLAWIFLKVVDDFSGWGVDERVASLSLELTFNLFGFAAIVIMLTAPLMAMRMFSGEFRDGTFDLVASAPVRVIELIAAKLLALATLLLPLALLPVLNAALLEVVTQGAADLDWGQLAAATLGLWLVAILFSSIGLYASSLTAQPGAGVLIAFTLLLLLSIIGRVDSMHSRELSLFAWFAWNEHLQWFLLGAVRLSDLFYLGALTSLFVALTHRRLVNRFLQ